MDVGVALNVISVPMLLESPPLVLSLLNVPRIQINEGTTSSSACCPHSPQLTKAAGSHNGSGQTQGDPRQGWASMKGQQKNPWGSKLHFLWGSLLSTVIWHLLYTRHCAKGEASEEGTIVFALRDIRGETEAERLPRLLSAGRTTHLSIHAKNIYEHWLCARPYVLHLGAACLPESSGSLSWGLPFTSFHGRRKGHGRPRSPTQSHKTGKRTPFWAS